MTTAVRPNTYDPSTWATYDAMVTDAVRLAICPACVVPVLQSMAEEHITKVHPATLHREGIVHVNEFDSIVTGFFLAPYRDQLAAIHSREGWTPEDVEKVLAVIYQYKTNGHVIAALESSWELAQKTALAWWSAERGSE